MYFCKGLVKTSGLLIVKGTFLCASFRHRKWVIELYQLLWLVELLVELWGAVMEQTPVRCAVNGWDTGSLYYTCSLTQVYWPLLEQEWTRPSARMFSLHADVVKGGAATAATLTLTSSAPRYTLHLPTNVLHSNPLYIQSWLICRSITEGCTMKNKFSSLHATQEKLFFYLFYFLLFFIYD